MAFPVTRRLVFESVRWRNHKDVFSITGTHRARSSASVVPPSPCPFHQAPTENGPALPKAASNKSFNEIPTPKLSFPLIGAMIPLLWNGGPKKLHYYVHDQHQKLGPILKVKIGPAETVAISQKDLILQLYSMDAKYPAHYLPEAWVLYNKKKGIKRGLFFMDGEEWWHRRKMMNPLFMHTKDIRKKHGQAFNEVVTHTLGKFDQISNQNNGHVLPNLENELYIWAMESLEAMFFGQRLDSSTAGKSHEFVKRMQQVFVESSKLSVCPTKLFHMLRLPVWRRFERAVTDSLNTMRKIIEEEVEKICSSQPKRGGILEDLLAHGNMACSEIVSTLTDLYLAAAETTSHAAQWELYKLAQNPHCQEKLLAEINSVVPPGEPVTQEHTDKMPYSSALIKETLRLYPIASFLTRIIPEDIVLGGYEIPSGTLISMSLYTVGMDPETFENPTAFIPERWMREKDKTYENKGHACIPFGMGVRSCIGRRVAEEQLRLLISRIVQNYHLELKNEEEIDQSLRMVTIPSQPIQIAFHPRSNQRRH